MFELVWSSQDLGVCNKLLLLRQDNLKWYIGGINNLIIFIKYDTNVFQDNDTVSDENEDEEDEEEELGQTDTYAEYVPSKCE